MDQSREEKERKLHYVNRISDWEIHFCNIWRRNDEDEWTEFVVNQGFYVLLPTRAYRTGFWKRRDLIDLTH